MSITFRKAVNKLQGVTYHALKYCTTIENQAKSPDVEVKVPIISELKHDVSDLYQKPRQVWIENLDTVKEKKLGLITLHPHVYATVPRIDIIHQNVKWQRLYRWVVSVTLYYRNYFFHIKSRD